MSELGTGVDSAVRGPLSVMAGGDFATFSRVLPILEAYSSTVTHMGPAGSGQATRVVNQVIVGRLAEAVDETPALSEKLNLPLERLLSVLCSGAADSGFLKHRGQSMLEDRIDVGFKLSLLLKDLKIIRALARKLDIELHTVDAVIGDYEVLVAAGDAGNDISGLIKRKRMQMSADRNEQERTNDRNG